MNFNVYGATMSLKTNLLKVVGINKRGFVYSLELDIVEASLGLGYGLVIANVCIWLGPVWFGDHWGIPGGINVQYNKGE